MFNNIDKARWISGIIIAIVVVLTAAAGGVLLQIFCLGLSVLALREYLKALDLEKSPLVPVIYAVDVIFFIVLTPLHFKAIGLCVFIAFLFAAIILILRYPQVPFKDLAELVFAFVYISAGLGYLMLARKLSGGVWILLLIYGCSLLGDVFGYIVGKKYGKHHMTPLLSPNKTYEGLAGEVIGVTVVALIYGLLFQSKMTDYQMPVLLCLISGFAGSLISVVGDLLASAVKRQYGIKDFGNLIPGHGGILDRIDSVLLTAPFVTYLFYLMQK